MNNKKSSLEVVPTVTNKKASVGLSVYLGGSNSRRDQQSYSKGGSGTAKDDSPHPTKEQWQNFGYLHIFLLHDKALKLTLIYAFTFLQWPHLSILVALSNRVSDL